MEAKVESEIREEKIKRIKDAEEKLERFKKTYKEISQSSISHISHNVSSTILRVVILILSMFLAVVGISFMMPLEVIGFLNNIAGMNVSPTSLALDFFFHAKFIFWLLALLLAWIFSLMRGNHRKRNTIHSFSKLLQEMIAHTQEYTREEKRKYEYFVDSSAKDNTEESQEEDQTGESTDTGEDGQADSP